MAECREDMDVPGIEVRVIGEPKGKGLFAVKPFKAGDVIFEERPLVCCQFAWNADYGYASCDFCMRPLEGAEENAHRLSGKKDLILPYPQCCPTRKENHCECALCGVRYCCVQCKDEAWAQYHQVLCLRKRERDGSHKLEMLVDVWKNLHYPPETASIMLLARILATVQQAQDKDGAVHLFMQLCHQTVNEQEEIAHKLLGEQFVGQLFTLRKIMSEIFTDQSVQHWLTPEGFQSLVALVGTNGQGVGTSPLSEWVKNVSALKLPQQDKENLDRFIDKLYDDVEEVMGSFLNNEGSALYALQSACNHSCEPNAAPNFPYSNFQLVMCAVRDIAAGEEICVSYLDDCALGRSRHSRHKILRENYLFTCHCSKCESESNEIDVTSEEEGDDGNESESDEEIDD
ncbi:hypothetical protein R5R35_003652 [Gryllus longicercus]|uniref:Protein-lysine N-trimethyltransferase SMYD5 n=1 Tax=Gryllus longicercus TaxID=2509291 RepID=A0AAN9ZBI0_9ORTH|nr:SET and MYND domain-containing protein 5 [Gryllus bimaculatus]